MNPTEAVLQAIRTCRVCEKFIEPHPVVTASAKSKIAIIGQAPGIKVHKSGIPWDDQSGDTLRNWLGVSKTDFYDTQNFAIIPMGFCYPGKGKNGDLPPRKECAPLWHDKLLAELKEIQLTLLIGQYAQKYYLKNQKWLNLTQTVNNFQDYLPKYFPLPHPSPRNFIWMNKNPWFEKEVLPVLKRTVTNVLK